MPSPEWSHDVVRDQLIAGILEDQIDARHGAHGLPNQGPYAPEAPTLEPDIRGQRGSVPTGSAFGTGKVNVFPGNKELNVLVADTPALRETGVQNRDDVGMANGTYDGMVFQWSEDTQAALHNKNVSFPVSAAWFDSSGMYVDHTHLRPGQATPVSPKGKHRSVLELHSDDWDALGMGPNSSISITKAVQNTPTVQMG